MLEGREEIPARSPAFVILKWNPDFDRIKPHSHLPLFKTEGLWATVAKFPLVILISPTCVILSQCHIPPLGPESTMSSSYTSGVTEQSRAPLLSIIINHWQPGSPYPSLKSSLSRAEKGIQLRGKIKMIHGILDEVKLAKAKREKRMVWGS